MNAYNTATHDPLIVLPKNKINDFLVYTGNILGMYYVVEKYSIRK